MALSELSAPLIADWHNAEVWSTTRVAPHKQFDRWREFVVDAHMRWAIRAIRCDRFPAYIRQGRFQGYRVTHLTSRKGGIVGNRGTAEIAGDQEALYNLIYIAEGSIMLEIGGTSTELKAGSFALWDSTRRMRFITGENLRQITLSVPHAMLHRVMPRADDCVGVRMEAGACDISRLFVDHLLSLDNNFGALPRSSAAHILDGAVDLLATTLSSKFQLDYAGPGAILLRLVMDFIVRHLHEPGLTTARVAKAHAISQRHLHRIFGAIDSSPAAWIRRQRLERCHAELARAPHLSITDIALRWGFNDPGSFSKIFRKEFGMSPRELRIADGI